MTEIIKPITVGDVIIPLELAIETVEAWLRANHGRRGAIADAIRNTHRSLDHALRELEPHQLDEVGVGVGPAGEWTRRSDHVYQELELAVARGDWAT